MKWRRSLQFLFDIIKQLNELNIKLQKRRINRTDVWQDKAFQIKIRLSKIQIKITFLYIFQHANHWSLLSRLYGSIATQKILGCWKLNFKVDFMILTCVKFNDPRALCHKFWCWLWGVRRCTNGTDKISVWFTCNKYLVVLEMPSSFYLLNCTSIYRNYLICLPNICYNW